MWTSPANRKRAEGPGVLLGTCLLLLVCACSANLEAIKAHEQRNEEKFAALTARVDVLRDSLAAVTARADRDRRAAEKRIQSLVDSLSVIQGRLAAEHKGRQMGDLNLDSQIALLTDEIREFEERMQRTPAEAPEPAAAAVPEQQMNGLQIKTAYNKGMQYFNRRKYARAIAVFEPISLPGLPSDLADNARYWIGECQYNLGKYAEALESFKKVFDFKKSNKDDDAQIKIAYTHLKMGARPAALGAFKKFIETYPYSEYIKDAERKAGELTSSLKMEKGGAGDN